MRPVYNFIARPKQVKHVGLFFLDEYPIRFVRSEFVYCIRAYLLQRTFVKMAPFLSEFFTFQFKLFEQMSERFKLM